MNNSKVIAAAVSMLALFSGESEAAPGAYPLAGITPQSISIGTVLTDISGATLYTYDGDSTPNQSSCNDQCAHIWPPLYVNFERVEGVYEVPKNVSGGWSMVDRKDGRKQWAYKGKPLYLYAGEKYFGESKGDGLNGKWHAARP